MIDSVESFIARRPGVTASALASAQSFVIDLCRLLGHPARHPTLEQDYMFERPISCRHGGSSPGRIDCYKRGCLVQEANKLRVGAGGTALSAKERPSTNAWSPSTLNAAQRKHKARSAGCAPTPAQAPTPASQQQWPATLPEQLATLASALGNAPQTESQLAARFTGKGRWKSRLPDILAALEALGRARRLDDGRWMG
jgi:hypothetical protein